MPDKLPDVPPPLKALMRAASGYPPLDRAVDKMDREFPADMVGVDVKPRSWMNPISGMNIAGDVDIESFDPHQRAQINIDPQLALAMDAPGLEQTVRHELEHVKQLRGGHKDEMLSALQRQGYSSRQYEKDAYAAGSAYTKSHGGQQVFHNDPDVLAQFPESPLMSAEDTIVKRLQGLMGNRGKITVGPDK